MKAMTFSGASKSSLSPTVFDKAHHRHSACTLGEMVTIENGLLCIALQTSGLLKDLKQM